MKALMVMWCNHSCEWLNACELRCVALCCVCVCVIRNTSKGCVEPSPVMNTILFFLLSSYVQN
jgi:hypothetical protein